MDLFFSKQNKKEVFDTMNDIIKRNFNKSINKEICLLLMKNIWSKYNKRPSNIKIGEHIDNLNKLSLNESIKYVKNNLNMNSQYNQPGIGAPLPFQQVDTKKAHLKPNSDVLLAQKISERNLLNNTIVKDDFVNLPNFNIIHSNQQEEQIGDYLKSHQRAHPAIVHQFLSMSTNAQSQFANTKPELYSQIINTIHQMNNETTNSKSGKSKKKVNIDDSDNDDNDNDDRGNGHSGNGNEDDDDDDYLGYLKNLDGSSTTITNSKKETNPDSNIDDIDTKVADADVSISKRSSKFKGIKTEYLALDFRKDLVGINNSKYRLCFPEYHNVHSISLESCMIQSDSLQGEPYLYIMLDEIEGAYNISKKNKKNKVFGKLLMEKSVNGFITYKPENCRMVFDKTKLLSHLTISFLQYNCEKLPLGKLVVKRLVKSDNTIQITTTTKHHLSVNDKVNVYLSKKDSLSVNNLSVIEVPDSKIAYLEKANDKIEKGCNLAFEKASIKCTLTFKIIYYE